MEDKNHLCRMKSRYVEKEKHPSFAFNRVEFHILIYMSGVPLSIFLLEQGFMSFLSSYFGFL